MVRWLLQREKVHPFALTTDVHSHLLPDLDDGVKSLEEAEAVIRIFQKLGYTKIITTPHVMQDHYRNTSEGILQALQKVIDHLARHEVTMELEAAAEYYLDEFLIKRMEAGEQFLTFGNNYLLFETNFLSEPLNMNEFIFLATTRGYKPVLAHPERYHYLQNDFSKIEDLLNRGVIFQINTSSITGAYSKSARVLAQKLIDEKHAHIIGSDCHSLHQAQGLEKVTQSRYFQKALTLPLLNHQL